MKCCCNDCVKYITETKVYSQNNTIPTNCNSVLFVNTGTIPVNIDNLTLQPSQSWSIDGNKNEICVKEYNFFFPIDLGPGQLTVIFKRYIK